MKKKGGVKKTRKQASPVREQSAMVVVPFSEIAKPEMYRGHMTLTASPFSEAQIKAIIAPTPKNIVKSRPGKGGGTWDYVPGWWFKKKANFVFGFAHDFEIIGERVDGDFITVKGQVTVRDPKTGRLTAKKTDYGGAQIKYMKGTKTPLDMGNDFKAAATDAFKRCMVQFGFAMDIYGKGETLEAGIVVQHEVKPSAAPTAKEVVVVNKEPQYECHNCAAFMTEAEAGYSKKFCKGKQLCRDCQKLYRQGVIK